MSTKRKRKDKQVEITGDSPTAVEQLEQKVRERTAALTAEIAERKKTEAKLILAAGEWRTTFDSISDWVSVHDKDFKIVRVNKAFADFLKMKPQEVIGKLCYEIIHGDKELCRDCSHIEALETRKPSRKEFFNPHLGIYMDVLCSPIFDDNGEPAFTVHVSRDITEKNRVEAELRESEEKYRSLFDNMRNGFAYCKMLFDEENKPVDFIYIDVNDTFEKLTGLRKEDVIGKRVTEAIPSIKELNPEIITIYGEVALTGRPTEFEVFFKPLDIWLTVSAYSPQKDHFVAVFDNITQRKLVEKALHASEENFRNSVDSSPLGIRIITEDGENLYTNRAMLNIFGYGSVEEQSSVLIKDRFTPGSYAEYLERKEKRKRGEYVPSSYETSIVRKDGEVRDLLSSQAEVLWNGKPGFQIVYHDVTERRRMEEKLRVNDRLASIGLLASGIAHELNNPLTGVIGFSEMLLSRELPDDVKGDLKIVHDQAMRASQIAKGLLTFSRKQTAEKEPLKIHNIIQGVLQLRSYEQRVSNITVKTEFISDLPMIMGNVGQLQQVFMNIICNAEQAMLEAHDKGTLDIVTQQVGDAVRICFIDDGPGIAPENIGNLFTPFFTTKAVGKGTGLGLSICQGIIAEHGGKIHAESEPGKGATFVIELPIASSRDERGLRK